MEVCAVLKEGSLDRELVTMLSTSDLEALSKRNSLLNKCDIIMAQYPHTLALHLGGLDYVEAATQLTFSAGNIRACVDIPITDDSISEPVETFTISLDPVSFAEGITITPSTASVTIIDNDGKRINELV